MPEITEEELVAFNSLKTSLEGLQTEFDAVKGKNEELLTETKTAKTKAREIEAAAEAERIRLATENNDHEQLYKSSQEKLTSTEKMLEDLQGNIATEKRNNAAMKIATELADGSNAELLAEFIGRRLKFSDEGLKVTDTSGNLTVSSPDDLKKEFASDARYAALLKGNQSSGGGATGGTNGSGASKEITRSALAELDPTQAAKFMKDGGTIIND